MNQFCISSRGYNFSIKMPQLSQKGSETAEAARRRKRELVERIPALAGAGARRQNRDMLRLKRDLEERLRLSTVRETEARPEIMYVDMTRNVGVVLGNARRIRIDLE